MRSEITDPIATTKFVLTRLDGTSVPITVIVGRPYIVEDFARCPVRVEGFEEYPDAVGEDTLQALSLSLMLVHRRLSDLLRSGHTLTDESGDRVTVRYLNAIFGRTAHRTRG